MVSNDELIRLAFADQEHSEIATVLLNDDFDAGEIVLDPTNNDDHEETKSSSTPATAPSEQQISVEEMKRKLLEAAASS